MVLGKVWLGGSKRAAGVSGLLLLFMLFWPSRGAAEAPAPDGEDAVYVYDVFDQEDNCGLVVARLKQLPLRSTVILSVEQESRFVLDDPGGEKLLACILKNLRATSRTVKALLLQDPSFADRTEEAMRRAARLGQFAARYPGRLAGAQVDVEPYTTETWGCGSTEDRRRLLRKLQQLLGLVRQQLRGLPLGVVVPWWFPAVSRELPEAAPEALFSVADEIYLMVYGDQGGPVVGGAAERVLRRVDAPEFFSGAGRLHVALATYEFASPAELETALETVRQRLDERPNFAGTAIFHAASTFNARLVRLASGKVVDKAGQGLPGVEIEAGGIRSRSNRCGKFFLRGFPEAEAELVLEKQGFRTRKLSVQSAAPGVVRNLGDVVLEKSQ